MAHDLVPRLATRTDERNHERWPASLYRVADRRSTRERHAVTTVVVGSPQPCYFSLWSSAGSGIEAATAA